MLTHVDFVSVFTISIAFNFTYVIIQKDNSPKKGFYKFFEIFTLSKIEFLQKTKSKYIEKLNFINKTIPKLEYYSKDNNDISKLCEECKKDIKEVKENIDKLLKDNQFYLDKILAINYMPSICFLLGLYGVWVLFVSPHEENLDINTYLFNMNGICLIYLIGCIFWDYSLSSRDNARGIICKIILRKLLKPKRRYVFFFFLAIIMAFIFFNTWSKIALPIIPNVWIDNAYYFTIFTCFSSFIVYSAYLLSRSIICTLVFKLKVSYYMQNESFKSALEKWREHKILIEDKEECVNSSNFDFPKDSNNTER